MAQSIILHRLRQFEIFREAQFQELALAIVAAGSGMEHGHLESTFPVARPAMAVGHGQDQDGFFHFSINHQEGKAGELESCGERGQRCGASKILSIV